MQTKLQERDLADGSSHYARMIRRNVRLIVLRAMQMVGMRNRNVLLTFDDGPHPVHTAKLLDDLKRAGVRAILFVRGENLESPEGKELLRRAAAEGHQVGNHTYSHLHLTELNENEIREEILKTERLIGALDRGRKILRPPYGEHNALVDRVARELGYRLVFWNVDTVDWHPSYRDSWVDRAMEQIASHERSILLAHDIHATTVEKVEDLIARVRKLPGRFIQYSDSDAFPEKGVFKE